jgi:hypothetical protein
MRFETEACFETEAGRGMMTVVRAICDEVSEVP